MLGLLAVGCLVICTNAAVTTPHHTAHNAAPHHTTQHVTPTAAPSNADLAKKITELESVIGGMARQMMLQQLYLEERIRTGGHSGIKQIRQGADGQAPYLTNTFIGGSSIGIHEHSNYDRTVGMGELDVVMNGVDFRTRHNDYKLVMPSTKSTAYNAVESIPFPDVPPSVLNKHTIAEQITEMRQYFKAFKMQQKSIRDYEPYFKPAMCFLEGGWTTDTKSLTEPFSSDRHHIDAANWMELQEKVRYTSYTGGKSELENYSYLPTTIINVTADGKPEYAQWNYRIVCHPIKENIHRYDFQMIDDLSARMKSMKNMTAYSKSRAPRFFVNRYSHKTRFDPETGTSTWRKGTSRYGLLDKIMAEIPGKDGYKAFLTDDSFGATQMSMAYKNNTRLNTARYHRWYKSERRGAMGLTVRHSGFSDSNLWVAQTSNPRIAPMSVTDCPKDHKTHKKVCTTYTRRYTYAIPLEIIWLTPLYNWNPYDLAFRSTYAERRKINEHGRNGGLNATKAFNGTSFNYFYKTPSDFFQGGNVNHDAADTARDAVGVLDKSNTVKHVMASGTRVFLPDIPGVGKLRIRYPIYPVDVEGSAIYKETAALRDVVMDMKTYSKMFEKRPEITDLDAHTPDSHFKTSTTHADPPGMHSHDVYLTAEEMLALKTNGTTVHVFTTLNNGHQHEMEVYLDARYSNRLGIKSCDGAAHCWDQHSSGLYKSN